MSRIYKYEVEVTDEFDVKMPRGAQVIHVDLQDGEPYMWALAEPSAELVVRTFYVHGTGHPINVSEKRHIGTFIDNGFVWHLFERTTESIQQ